MNNGSDHAICAFILWEAQARCKQFEMENAALHHEIERLKAAEKPEPLKAVPPPEEKGHGTVG